MGDTVNLVWKENLKPLSFSRLQSDIKTDVLIIGGGMAGILCAYMLGKSGVDCILVEADKICSGITKNTTAKITSQHGLIYNKLVKKFGAENAQMYLGANEAAVEKYRSICKNIDCDFKNIDSYVYSVASFEKLEDELNALNKIGFNAELVENTELPFKTAGAVRFKNQAMFNPLKFVSAIAPNLKIYENTKVLELADNTAVTESCKITANKIIVTTHFPFINKHGSYFLKMYQHRSYVIALENAQQLNGVYVDEAETGMSFRNYKNFLLVGGGGHRTGKDGGNWHELEYFAEKYYSGASVKYRWATQDCMTLDDVPYIGNYSKSTPDLYVATGFNKWGMTSSMVAAEILADMVTGKENPYCNVFSPSRSMLRPQLAVNAFEALANLLTISGKRCPHMGCALKWNEAEHTWDCPCHGSRFTEVGELIDNPSTDDLK